MASSVRSSPNAFPAEIARYLVLDPDEVHHMIKSGSMPAFKVPAKTRHVHRVPLRDFHAWLLKRSVNGTPQLAKYETFLADFDSTARRPRTSKKTP